MTTATFALYALIPVAYAVGSIPFGLLVGLSRGVDPRKAGSGNIGATNVGRLLGKKYFAIVFLLDLLKGLLPVLAAGEIIHGNVFPNVARPDSVTAYAQWIVVALAAILGHMFSLYIGFKGGKGVATSAGVVLGIYPYYTLPGAAAALIFLLVFKSTRYVSAASISAAAGFTIAYFALGIALNWPIFGEQFPLLLFAALIATMIIYRHRDNIMRLRAGTEHRIGTRPTAVVEK